MRSTFKVLFYTKNQAIKNGRVPVMGRITVNGTTASFSCKRDVSLSLMGCQRKLCQGQVRRGQTAKPGTGQYQGTDQQALPVYL